MKTHFTRKNLISLGLVFFYVLFALVAALLIDATNPTGLKENMNIIRNISKALFLKDFNGSTGAWVLIGLVLAYIMIFAATFIFETRLAKYNGQKTTSGKWVTIYIVTFVICFGLAFGIGIAAQYPYKGDMIINALLFLFASLLVGLLMYAFAFIAIGATVMLVVNFKNIDKPFKFFGNKYQEIDEKEDEDDKLEADITNNMGKLPESFGETSTLSSINGATTLGGLNNYSSLLEKEKVFPGLCTIDVVEEARRDEIYQDEIDLETLCIQFRNYLAKTEKLFFSIETIRAFISGLAASRLIILEGLSGTGKSSLARYFSEFIEEESYFEAVQATWRDRTSILGYYNDFSRSYNETEFLKRLYSANYRTHNVNIMVLDEVNISRIEYYFADFLSILEYPKDKWKLKIMQLPYDFEGPKFLEDGNLTIPENTWFIATANKDDSTYTITDKVYDRAITISFDDRNDEFEVTGDASKVHISYDHLNDLFNKALEVKSNQLSIKDKEKFKKITDFTYDAFDLTYGNRINNQIEILVPVYAACGGTKEEALDFMFSRKVVNKLAGRFEDYIEQGLNDLISLIDSVYGKDSFLTTRHEINKLLKKF